VPGLFHENMDRSRKMSSYNIAPKDVQDALREQNVEAAPGKIGENAEGIYEYVIKYKGRLSEVKDYENYKVYGNGTLRIKDVAKVELGAFNYGTKNIAMGKEVL
jgi:HAE1 family hydrophobic/amphiphilic exporter-1